MRLVEPADDSGQPLASSVNHMDARYLTELRRYLTAEISTTSGLIE